jgi:hypothetical protein
MTSLSAFVLFAVTAMLITYALEQRSSWFVLAFAVACALGSASRFLQAASPFVRRRGDLVGPLVRSGRVIAPWH